LIFVFIRAKLLGMSVQRLADLKLGDVVSIEHVGGERAFRRRLMELGLVPGTRVELVAVAPLGDPIELLVRGSSLSIRRADAAAVRVTREGLEAKLPAGEKSGAGLATSAVRGTS
jgi:ferrous iron transport protein A